MLLLLLLFLSLSSIDDETYAYILEMFKVPKSEYYHSTEEMQPKRSQ